MPSGSHSSVAKPEARFNSSSYEALVADTVLESGAQLCASLSCFTAMFAGRLGKQLNSTKRGGSQAVPSNSASPEVPSILHFHQLRRDQINRRQIEALTSLSSHLGSSFLQRAAQHRFSHGGWTSSSSSPIRPSAENLFVLADVHRRFCRCCGVHLIRGVTEMVLLPANDQTRSVQLGDATKTAEDGSNAGKRSLIRSASQPRWRSCRSCHERYLSGHHDNCKLLQSCCSVRTQQQQRAKKASDIGESNLGIMPTLGRPRRRQRRKTARKAAPKTSAALQRSIPTLGRSANSSKSRPAAAAPQQQQMQQQVKFGNAPQPVTAPLAGSTRPPSKQPRSAGNNSTGDDDNSKAPLIGDAPVTKKARSEVKSNTPISGMPSRAAKAPPAAPPATKNAQRRPAPGGKSSAPSASSAGASFLDSLGLGGV